MIIFTSILAFLVLPTLGLPDDRPVEVNEVKNVIIEDYQGILNDTLLALHVNAESLKIVSSVLSSFSMDLCKFRKLKNLTMEKNDITSLSINLNSCGQYLEKIELWENDYAGHKEWLKQIGGLSYLKTIGLSEQNFRTLENYILRSSYLQKLSIESGRLTTIQDNAFYYTRKLEYLSLKDNKISSINKDVLANLANLKALNLKGNKFTRLATDMLPSLRYLVELNLDYNNLTEINLEGIEKVAPALRDVYVDGVTNLTSVQCSKSKECVLSKKTVLYKICLDNQMNETSTQNFTD